VLAFNKSVTALTEWINLSAAASCFSLSYLKLKLFMVVFPKAPFPLIPVFVGLKLLLIGLIGYSCKSSLINGEFISVVFIWGGIVDICFISEFTYGPLAPISGNFYPLALNWLISLSAPNYLWFDIGAATDAANFLDYSSKTDFCSSNFFFIIISCY
jgi:hypothetical protein